MPGTLVLIGLNGPRISAGAFGFMSQVSSWDGPPTRNSMMQLTSLAVSTAPSAFRPNTSCEAERRKGAGMQEVAPAQSVTKLNRPVRIQT